MTSDFGGFYVLWSWPLTFWKMELHFLGPWGTSIGLPISIFLRFFVFELRAHTVRDGRTRRVTRLIGRPRNNRGSIFLMEHWVMLLVNIVVCHFYVLQKRQHAIRPTFISDELTMSSAGDRKGCYICDRQWRTHFSAVDELHWLFSIQLLAAARNWQRQSRFEVGYFCFRIDIHHQCGPAYLSNLVQFNTAESGRRQLRSSTTNAAFVVRMRTQFGKCAFSVCGPSIWNQIPPHIRNLHSAPAFRKALKTHLFLQLSTL